METYSPLTVLENTLYTFAMTIKSEQFLVDNRGRATSVVLPVAEYKKIIRHMHDLEDSLDLKQAIATSRGTISHASLLEQLKSRGIL